MKTTVLHGRMCITMLLHVYGQLLHMFQDIEFYKKSTMFQDISISVLLEAPE